MSEKRRMNLPLLLAFALLASCSQGSTSSPSATPDGGGAAATSDEAGDAGAASTAADGAAPDGGTPTTSDARDIPAAVMLDQVPEIPNELRRRLSQYLNTRRASFQAVAADGSRLLVTTRFADTDQIHEVSSPLGVRRQLTFADEPLRHAEYSRDGEAILFMTDVGGGEDYQIARFDRATGRTALLTDGESRHGSYVQSLDGARVAYTSNARNGRDMDIYVGDGRTAEAGRLLLEREGHWWAEDFSRDGERLLIGKYVSINESQYHVVDIQSREVRRLTPEEPRASYRDAAFGPSSDVLYITSDREGEFVELYRVELSGEEPAWTPLTRDIPWNVEQISLSGDGGTLAFTTNEDGYSVLRLLDTATGQIRQPEGLPRGLMSGLEYAHEANVLGFTVQGPGMTGDAYLYDVGQGELTRWTESEMGGLDPESFIEPTLFRYQSFDDREIPAFYYRPEGDGPFPVVVYIHGGPESQSRPWFSAFFQYLAVESGIAVLAPNVRGSDGYGKSYLLLDNGRRREDSVRDIGALLDWVGEQEELDEERMAVFGGSYGGYMVLASLVHFGDRLDAAVDIVGITSFVTFLENTREYRRDLRRAEYGDERDEEMREFLESISPVNNVERIRSALFVAHGQNDPRVPVSESEQLIRAVRENDQEVWYMLARNEGHGFRKKENRDLFYEISVLFLERHLLRGDGE